MTSRKEKGAWTEPALVKRLDRFIETWLSNPAAQFDFVKLVDTVRQLPSNDHADDALLAWIDEQRAGLKSIGVR